MPVARQSASIIAKVASGGGNYGVPSEWTSTTYGPGWPIAPVEAPNDTALPRSIDYPIAVNTTLIPRISYGLMPFASLYSASEAVAECKVPIMAIVRELMSWKARLVDSDGNEVPDHDFSWMCKTPDGKRPFSVWLNRFLKSAKIYDAPALYLNRNNGVINGLEYIDGSTLFVIVDETGNIPAPENVKDYVSRMSQKAITPRTNIPKGSPNPITSLMEFVTKYSDRQKRGDDVPTKIPAFTQVIKGTPYAWWSADDIWYEPQSPRTNAPYGESFIEQAWAWVMIIVNLTAFELGHYRTGNMPEGFVTVPKDLFPNTTKIIAAEELFNARMTSNPSTERNRLRIFPDGSKYFPTKKPDFPDRLYKQARDIILNAIGLLPSELGETPGTGLGGKGFKEGAESESDRITFGPQAAFVATPFNDVLKREGVTDVTFELARELREVDPDKQRQAVFDGMAHGTLSLNDALGELNMSPLGNPDDPNNIANKHLIVAGSVIYVIEDMQVENGMAVPTFSGQQGGNAGGSPVNPESVVEQDGKEHTPEDKKTLEQAIRNLQNGGSLTGKFISIPSGVTFSQDTVKPAEPLVKVEPTLSLVKHCGVCPEDDEYFGAPISREASFTFPNGHHANGVELVAMTPDGLPAKAALWKPEGAEVPGLQDYIGGPQYVREEAAYLLDRALGFNLVPVAYVAENSDEMGAAIYYTFEATPGQPFADYAPQWIERAAVLDYVMSQQDRGAVGHNTLTHPDDPTRPVLIDNGLAFPTNPDLYCNSGFCAAWVNKPLGVDTLAALLACKGDTSTWHDIEALVGAAAVKKALLCLQRLLDEKMITAEPSEEQRT